MKNHRAFIRVAGTKRWLGDRCADVLAALIVAIVALSAVGQTAPPVGRPSMGDTAATGSATYEPGDLYLAGSRVYVFVGKTGFGHEHGIEGQIKQGKIHLDNPQDCGQLVFDMASFAADPAAARAYVDLAGTEDASSQQQITDTMHGSAVLAVSRYPTATFQIKTVTPLNDKSKRGLPQYQLDGDFTLHGTTQPIKIVADVEEKGGWIHLRGGFALLQTQYKMRPYTTGLGAVGVSNKLQIYGDLWVAKERQTSPPPADDAK